MIVQELAGEYVNIYVDGYVFSAEGSHRQWSFGDGVNDSARIETEAARRAMRADEFASYYRGICNAAAGWEDPDWVYRYNVVAMDGFATQMLQEVMGRVEEAIERSGAQKDREKAQEMLKRYASLGVIRQNGLAIRKYIYNRSRGGKGRIVYLMEELTPSWISSLIPQKVLESAIHRP